ITHGCRSEKLILRHEDPAEFEALRAAWFRHYQPETEIASALLEETVRAHWLLKRAQKQLDDIAWELPANAYHWTEEQERLFRNFTRYKNSHERTFFRFFKELEAHFQRNTPPAEMKQRALVIAARIQKPLPREETQSAPEPEAPGIGSHPDASGKSPLKSQPLDQRLICQCEQLEAQQKTCLNT
ncbi:MAG TPA: hypothetical protein VH437_11105, partial [Terriglobales bacterium]